MVRLDIPYVFELAGGPKGLLDLFDRHVPGHELPYSTVQMWSHRKSISARWLPAVLYVMSRQGHQPLSLMTDDEELVG